MAYTIEEEEDLNKLKTWWKENGKVVVVAVILAIAGVIGWHFWQSHQIQQRANASAGYDQLIYATEKDPKVQSQKVAEFVKANSKTGYAVFALLDEANKAVARQDLAQAESVLTQAVEQSQDEILASISALRLAAVQYQQKEFDKALASLNNVKAESFAARKNLLAGDIQAAKGDKAAAKASFERAESAKNASPFELQTAKLRLNSL